MKTAVSIPDEVFIEAERAAAQAGMSRSGFYTRALSDFLARGVDDPVTAALDALADEMDADPQPGSGRVLIDSGTWQW